MNIHDVIINIVIYCPGYRLHNGDCLYSNNDILIVTTNIWRFFQTMHQFVLVTFVQHSLDAILEFNCVFSYLIFWRHTPIHKL